MTPADRSALREQVEAEALKYHKATDGTGEGEYGCPGVKCPGVQRLTDFWWPALERIAASLPSGEMALRTVLRLLAENRYDKLPRLDNIVDEDDAYGLDFGHANWSLSLSVYDCGDVGWSLLANDTASYGRAPISEWETNVHPVLQQFLAAASLPPETPSGGQEPTRSHEWVAINCHTLARREIRRLDSWRKGGGDTTPIGMAVTAWQHVLRICELAGAHGAGVLRASPPPPADAGARAVLREVAKLKGAPYFNGYHCVFCGANSALPLVSRSTHYDDCLWPRAQAALASPATPAKETP